MLNALVSQPQPHAAGAIGCDPQPHRDLIGGHGDRGTEGGEPALQRRREQRAALHVYHFRGIQSRQADAAVGDAEVELVAEFPGRGIGVVNLTSVAAEYA